MKKYQFHQNIDMATALQSAKTPVRLYFSVIAIMIFSFSASAQEQIDSYIEEAFTNNIVLKEKKISLDKSLLALKEARSLFLPSTSFDAQYLLAKGGRTIDVPVGTLLNPVYTTLNQLTGSDKFPMIDNASEQLNPNNFYDVRIKTVMPIINPDIRINRDIKEQQIQLQQYEVDIYKRELVKEVKTAYFNYIMATKAIDIYLSALDLVKQNVKVNRSLLANGKGLPAYVSRAEAEEVQVENQIQNAKNEQQNAQAYFNFLLNKPFISDITIEPEYNSDISLLTDTTAYTNDREELKSLSKAIDINENIIRMNRSFRTPRLNAFLDLGSQGFNFDVSDKSIFYLGGIQLKFPIFSGRSNIYKIEQARLDGQNLLIKETEVKQQFALAASVSRNNVKTAYNTYQSLMKQQESLEKYFHLISRGYQEGVNSFIEYLDARNQLTGIRQQVNIQQFKVLVALADFERQTASYLLK